MLAPRKQGGTVHPPRRKLLNASDSGSLGVRWEGSDFHHIVVEPEDVSISRAALSVGTLLSQACKSKYFKGQVGTGQLILKIKMT